MLVPEACTLREHLVPSPPASGATSPCFHLNSTASCPPVLLAPPQVRSAQQAHRLHD
jgi:hypothetical protein